MRSSRSLRDEPRPGHVLDGGELAAADARGNGLGRAMGQGASPRRLAGTRAGRLDAGAEARFKASRLALPRPAPSRPP